MIKSTLILLAALGAARILRRQSAAVRHLIWTVGLISALSIPVLPPLLPAWPAWPAVGSSALYSRVQEQKEIVADALTTGNAGNAPATGSLSPAASPYTLEDAAYVVWAAGFAAALAVLFAGAVRLAWLMSSSRPMGSERWKTAADGISRALKLERQIHLLCSGQSSTLGTWGIVRGRILLPQDAANWPEERIRVVLAHEMAHIKRFDWIVQVAAEFARAIYWFNPLFWLACKRLRLESEHACDDAVMNLGIDGQTYAAHLLELARGLNNPERAWSPVLAMAQRPHLERRFVAMLNPYLNRRPASLRVLAAIGLAAVCLTLPLASMQGREQATPAAQAQAAPVAKVAPPKAAPAAPIGRPGPAALASNVAPKTARPPARVPLQEGLGTISGSVYDATGAAIPGAGVTLLNLDARARQDFISSEAGAFNFPRLLPGRYLLQVQLPGFQNSNSGVLEIQGSERLQRNVTLVVGSVAERIQVVAPGTPKAAAAADALAPRRIRVGGNIQAPNLISRVTPVYPQSARDAGMEGTVRLQGVIGADGSMLALQVLNAGQVDIELANAARGAVSQWRYRPTLLNGIPIEMLTSIDIDFKLTQ